MLTCRRFRWFQVLILPAMLATPISAATITESGFWADVVDTSYYSAPGSIPSSFSFSDGLIIGINKFDPALGTLNSVTLTANYSVWVETEVFTANPDDSLLSHGVDFDTLDVQFFIGYIPKGSFDPIPLVGTELNADGSCFFSRGNPAALLSSGTVRRSRGQTLCLT